MPMKLPIVVRLLVTGETRTYKYNLNAIVSDLCSFAPWLVTGQIFTLKWMRCGLSHLLKIEKKLQGIRLLMEFQLEVEDTFQPVAIKVIQRVNVRDHRPQLLSKSASSLGKNKVFLFCLDFEVSVKCEPCGRSETFQESTSLLLVSIYMMC